MKVLLLLLLLTTEGDGRGESPPTGDTEAAELGEATGDAAASVSEQQSNEHEKSSDSMRCIDRSRNAFYRERNAERQGTHKAHATIER